MSKRCVRAASSSQDRGSSVVGYTGGYPHQIYPHLRCEYRSVISEALRLLGSYHASVKQYVA
jgi:hypothetical protein